MSELLKKELREYGLPALAALVALCIAWMNLGRVSYVLLEPHAEVSVLVVLGAALAGAGMGYAQFAIERARGTFAYLVHRRGGYVELFRAKAFAGVGVALALGMLPPVVFGAAKLLSPYAPLVLPERILEHALAGLVAIPAWGAGVLVALFSRSVLASLVCGLLAALGLVLVSSVLPLPVMRMSALAPTLFVLAVLVAGWILLRFARSVFESAVDRDGTLAWKRQLACALLALPLFVQPAWILASGAATTAQHSLFSSYPELVRDADGSFRLEDPGRLLEEQRLAIGPDGTRKPAAWTEVVRPAPGQTFEDGWQTVRRYRRMPLDGIASNLRWESQSSHWRPGETALKDKQGRILSAPDPEFATFGRIYLDRGEGVVRIACGLDFSWRSEEPDLGHWTSPRTAVLERNGTATLLGRETLVVGDLGAPPLFVDPSDKTLWTIDFAESGERLAEVVLPDGDTLRDARPQCDTALAHNGILVRSSTAAVLFVGERANYAWGANGFTVAQPGSELDDEGLRARLGYEWRVESPRMDTLTVEVRSTKDASALYAHTFEPRTSDQRILGAIARLGGMFSPPSTSVLQLLGLADAFPAGGMSFVFARAVADTTAYHLAHVSLGLALAALAWMRVARRGGSTREKLLWSAYCGVFGVFALLFHALLAPRPRIQAAPAVPVRSAPAAAV